MGPATALHSPRRLHDLGAVGGQRGEVNLPPPFDKLEGDVVDRLYHETMENFYSTGTNDDVADHGDETASTSSAQEPAYVVLNNDHTTDVPPPQLGG